MNYQVDNLDNNMAKITITVDAKTFDAACKTAYNKQKGSFNIPGFRKGKVPMNMIEKVYGAGVFYEEAANQLMNDTYPEAATESGLEIVSSPSADVIQIGKGKDFIYTATVAVKPELTLGQYKGLEIDKVAVEVTEEDINAELTKAQNAQAREIDVTDRAVEMGDKIVLNYAGTIDGVPFDGGTATNQNLEIGSHSFIDTFEDQLVGLNIGDVKDVEVTFPEEYHAPELAGKKASFHCEILGIKTKELPEIDDDFAQDTTEFDSLEEYKEDIRGKLTLAKEEQAKSAMENALMAQMMETAVVDIPEAMIDSEVEQMINEFKQRVSMQGLSFEQYLQYTGQDMDAMKAEMRPEAVKRIKSTLILETIAKAEGIEATEEDLNKEFEQMAAMYQMDVETISGYIQGAERENMMNNIALNKAMDFVLDQAVITEASEDLEFEG